MDCFYLIMPVELALALALGGTEKEGLPDQSGDTISGLDVAYTAALIDKF